MPLDESLVMFERADALRQSFRRDAAIPGGKTHGKSPPDAGFKKRRLTRFAPYTPPFV